MSKIIERLKRIRLRLGACLHPKERERMRFKALLKLEKLQRRNTIEIAPEDILRVDFRITGRNNTLKIGRLRRGTGRVVVMVHGEGNEIVLDEAIAVSRNLLIVAGITPANFGPVNDVKIHIGARCSFEKTRIQTFNSHAKINIGERCMFSYDINVYHTDGHPILSVETGEVLNKVRSLSIGNHVWVGAQATITKNVTIGDDCIVGWGAVVGHSFSEPNCVLAGNPAKIVKRGITWDANGAKHGYISGDKN